MHTLFPTIGEHTFGERRLAFLEGQPEQESPSKVEVSRQIEEDVKYMDNLLETLLHNIEAGTKRSSMSGRAASVERQSLSIRDRLIQIQNRQFKTREEFNEVRNRLVGEVENLLLYAQFQAAQNQAETPVTRLEYTEEEHNGSRRILIQTAETVDFSYINGAGDLSRSVGTISIPKRRIAYPSPGLFLAERITREGQPYVMVTVDPAFNGTFTFSSEGRRATVDVASHGTERQRQAKLREAAAKNTAESQVSEQERSTLSADLLMNFHIAGFHPDSQAPAPDRFCTITLENRSGSGAERTGDAVIRLNPASPEQQRINTALILRFIGENGIQEFSREQNDTVITLPGMTAARLEALNIFLRRITDVPRLQSRIQDINRSRLFGLHPTTVGISRPELNQQFEQYAVYLDPASQAIYRELMAAPGDHMEWRTYSGDPANTLYQYRIGGKGNLERSQERGLQRAYDIYTLQNGAWGWVPFQRN